MSTTRRDFLGIAGVSGLGLAIGPTKLAMANPPKSGEPIIDPDLPIIDAHHHLWVLTEDYFTRMEAQDDVMTRGWVAVYRSHARYLLDEFLADVTTGHNVRATVFVECGAMYRATGPEALKPVGEVEFANGVAAMAASKIFGNVKVCAGIVGNPNLSLGNAAEAILRAHIQAADGRFRGVRNHPAGGLLDKEFRSGFKWLSKFGLPFDALVLEPQLPDLINLARAFPDTQIILNHVGILPGAGRQGIQREERFPIWRDNIRTLSVCSNVVVKLGGLGMPLPGFKSFMSTPRFTSQQLAEEWKPYLETCIEAFGANRCMFESNFPVDSGTCTYPVLWNTFKRLAAGASAAEKTALFSGTAARVYRLDT
jgi:predicted TIM-barrel fold metal-dependent hydrolase